MRTRKLSIALEILVIWIKFTTMLFTIFLPIVSYTFRITCPLDKGAANEDIVTVAYTNALSTFDNSYEEIIKALYLENGSGED